MKKNNDWFSIIIWMWLVLVISLMAYFILSFIIPFSKNIKWIENWTNAYYQSYAWVEESLYFVKNRSSLIKETSSVSNNPVWYSYSTTSSWNLMPLPWTWDSDYDANFSTISIWNPAQLEVWRNTFQWSNVNFLFKVPNFDNNISTTENFYSWTTPIINWWISSESDSLMATWSYITANDIKNSNCSSNCTIKLTDTSFRKWFRLNWTEQNFQDFYNEQCTWTNSWCILRLSVLNDLKLMDKTLIPYLEYKIDFWNQKAPLRHTIINSTWKSYWFKKDLNVRVPQQTINQAFDFTVFQ